MASVTLMAKLTGDAKGLIDTFAAAETKAGGMGTALKAAGDAARPAFLALGGLASGAVLQFASLGSTIYDMSQRTGLGATAISELKFAAEQSGGSIEGLETGIRKMQIAITNASQGNDILTQNFERLGISVKDIVNLNPDQQFTKITAAIASIEDPTQRAAAAVDFFGKAGTGLLPMLDGGAAGMEQLRQRAHELGFVLDDEAAKKADALGDSLDQLKGVANKLAVEVGSKLAPAVTAVVTVLAEMPSTLQAIVVGMFAVGTASKLMGASMQGALISTGIGAAIIVIVLALEALEAKTGVLSRAFRWMGDHWRDVVNGMISGVEFLANAFTWEFRTMIQKSGDFVETLLGIASHIPGVGEKFKGMAAEVNSLTERIGSATVHIGRLTEAQDHLAGVSIEDALAVAAEHASVHNYGVELPKVTNAVGGLTAAQKALEEQMRKAQERADSLTQSLARNADEAARNAGSYLTTLLNAGVPIEEAVKQSEALKGAAFNADVAKISAAFEKGTVTWDEAQRLIHARSVGTPDPLDVELGLVPKLAHGGIVRARPGGTMALLGEGGRDEAVVPLDAGVGGVTVNIYALDGQTAADATVRALTLLVKQGRISPITILGAA